MALVTLDRVRTDGGDRGASRPRGLSLGALPGLALAGDDLESDVAVPDHVPGEPHGRSPDPPLPSGGQLGSGRGSGLVRTWRRRLLEACVSRTLAAASTNSCPGWRRRGCWYARRTFRGFACVPESPYTHHYRPWPIGIEPTPTPTPISSSTSSRIYRPSRRRSPEPRRGGGSKPPRGPAASWAEAPIQGARREARGSAAPAAARRAHRRGDRRCGRSFSASSCRGESANELFYSGYMGTSQPSRSPRRLSARAHGPADDPEPSRRSTRDSPACRSSRRRLSTGPSHWILPGRSSPSSRASSIRWSSVKAFPRPSAPLPRCSPRATRPRRGAAP